MSQRCIGYEGEGKHRRPIWAPEGPASVSASSPFAMHGRLSAFLIPETAGQIEGGGAGQIERRQITDAERSEREPAPSPIAPIRRSEEQRLASFHRGGEATKAARAALRAVEPGPSSDTEEESVMAIVPPPELPIIVTRTEERIVALQALQEAALEAQEAVQELETANVAQARADERWWLAQRRLQRAQEAVEAALGPDDDVALDDDPEPPAHLPAQSIELANGIVERAVEPADDAPEVVTRPAPRRQVDEPRTPGLTPRQQSAIRGLVAGRTRAEVARQMGTSYQTIDGLIEAAAKKGLVPAELFPVLPARFAKYATPAR